MSRQFSIWLIQPATVEGVSLQHKSIAFVTLLRHSFALMLLMFSFESTLWSTIEAHLNILARRSRLLAFGVCFHSPKLITFPNFPQHHLNLPHEIHSWSSAQKKNKRYFIHHFIDILISILSSDLGSYIAKV